MGGNGAYSDIFKGIPDEAKAYLDSSYRVDGHKILIQKKDVYQNSIPMNSNSESPIYLCAKVDKKTNNVMVSTIAIYENHKIKETIDIKIDKNGNFIPFGDKNGSHLHYWFEKPNGAMGRKSHDKTNDYPIPQKYNELINKILTFNKSHKQWIKKEK